MESHQIGIWPAAALALALVLVLAAPATAAPAPALGAEQRALCHQINDYRAQHGLAPLRVAPSLMRAARWLSTDMARHDYFDHVDSRGRDFSRRLTAFGYRGATRAEDIAAGTADAASTFEQWRGSPQHERNMLSARHRVIGIGRAYGAGTLLGWYWTATFGRSTSRGSAC